MSEQTFYGKVRSVQTFMKDGAVQHRVYVSTGHPRSRAEARLEVLEPETLTQPFLAELIRAQNHGFSVSVSLREGKVVELQVD